MTRTQAFRHMALSGPGDEVLLLRSIEGTEELGRPFEFVLECVSEDAEVVFEDWLGQSVTVRLSTHGGDRERFLNGVVSQIEQTGVVGRLSVYRLVMVPFVWLMSRRADCRIFQDKTVPEIVQELMKEKGFTDIEDRLSREYKPRPYCVQYRETDLNFMHRLLEHEGIYYYFVHEEGKHTLVLSDSRGSHDQEPGAESLPYFPPGAKSVERSHVYHWRVRKQIQTTAYSTTDYNFEKPKEDLYVRGSKARQHAFGEIEIFDYPGDHEEYEDGETRVRLRTEELDVGYETIDAQTTSRQACAGRTFALTGHPRGDQAREYLVVGTTITASTDAYDGGKIDSDGSFTFRCGFDCIPLDTPYRRACTTPKPVIAGPQTAFVTGLEGEEVTCDEHGRVKVKFHWDLYGKADETSSCWLRVSQEFAGKKWGSHYVPRRGQEVIVTFLEGDPDRPLITGRVYNAENRPPYDPKALPTVSGVKTCTVKGEGFNEIRFDDKADAEQIFIHAQKDMDIRVKDTVRYTVEKEYHFTVESDHFEKTGGDHHLEVAGSYYETTGGDRHIIADGNELKLVSGNQDLTVSGSVAEGVSGSMTTEVSGAIKIKSPTSIVLECGGTRLSVLPDGVLIEGTNFAAKASAKALVESGGPTTINAGGGLMVSAGTVDVKTGACTVAAGAVKLDAGMVSMSGVATAMTFIAQAAIVSPSYTPGAGNIV